MKKVMKILLIIFCFLFALSALSQNVFAGILLIFSVLILLKRTKTFINKKLNINLKFSVQIMISLLLFILASLILTTDYDIYNIDNNSYESQNSFSNINNASIETASNSTNEPETKKYTILRVVDGDTVKLNFNGKEESVRLIGIDTPESVHPDEDKNTEFGKEASDFTKNYLEGKEVTLEFDVQERDTYGRLLAYLYINGEMFNKILIQEGYAKIATYPPNIKYVEDFTKLQEEARNSKKGLWSNTTITNPNNTTNTSISNINTTVNTTKKDTSSEASSSSNKSSTTQNKSTENKTNNNKSTQSSSPQSSSSKSTETSGTSKNIQYNGHSVFHIEGGKVYHYSSKCSNMKSPIETTLENAKNKNLSPCSKCVK